MITEFAKAVCIPELSLLGTSRNHEISDARELYWLILHKNGFGYSEIARLCDRTHATIMSGIRRANKLLEVKDDKMTRLYELTKHIKRYGYAETGNSIDLQPRKEDVDIDL